MATGIYASKATTGNEAAPKGWLEMLKAIIPEFAAQHGIAPPGDGDPTHAQPIPAPISAPPDTPRLAPSQIQVPRSQNPAPIAPPPVAPTQMQEPASQVNDQNAANQAEAAAAPPTPTMSAIGAALSGVTKPTVPQYNLPGAPSVPGTKPVDSHLYDLIASLSAPAAKGGLNLKGRI